MDNIFVDKILATLRDLIYNATPLYILLMLEVFLQIAPLTILGDEVAVVLGVVDIYESDDIGVF